MASRLQLAFLVLACSVLVTSAIRGALFRNGRSFLRNQTPMSVEEQSDEPSKRSAVSTLQSGQQSSLTPSAAFRERLLLRQLLHEMVQENI